MQVKKFQDMSLKEKITSIVVLIFIAFIILIVIAGLSSGSKKEAKPKDTPSKLDASATIACQDFNRAISDVKAGILTNEEFRDKIQKVYDNARLGSKIVKQPAQDLLKAVTSGTTEEAVAATQGFQEACKE